MEGLESLLSSLTVSASDRDAGEFDPENANVKLSVWAGIRGTHCNLSADERTFEACDLATGWYFRSVLSKVRSTDQLFLFWAG